MIFLSLLFQALLAQGDIAKLDWMAGCWTGTVGPVTFEEHWMPPAGELMLGAARNLKAGRVIFHEFMRISIEDGKITYTPRIGTKQGPVPFALLRQSETEVVFENPAHDFPQRILYRRTSDGLAARIEGVQKGKPRAEDYPMKRCR